MSQIRKLIEAVNEGMYDVTDPEKVRKANEIKLQLNDVVDNIEDIELRTQMWRTIHRVLDNYAPGWDNEGY